MPAKMSFAPCWVIAEAATPKTEGQISGEDKGVAFPTGIG